MSSTVVKCGCKSSCSIKRKENGKRGCPCKGQNIECSADCQCGTRDKPCQNQGIVENEERQRKSHDENLLGVPSRKRGKNNQGFRLSYEPRESEEKQREKEHQDGKNFIETLDEKMVKKLAIRSLRRGIGSMDYIDTLLIMEDDLDDDDEENMHEFGESSDIDIIQTVQSIATKSQPNVDPTQVRPHVTLPDWCKCGKCQPMPQEIENKCCRQKNCITNSSRFAKICLDPDVLELCIRSTNDIRNDREDNSTRAFRKAAHRQFILAGHGHLGKGNRRVCPSCAVLEIRKRFPSVTGVYMGYREH